MKAMKRWFFLTVLFFKMGEPKSFDYRWARFCLHVNRPQLKNNFITRIQRMKIQKYQTT